MHPVHVWRDTTASHLALAGVDVTVIQGLGHVSITTTCRYKGIPIETKREALRKFYLFEQSWQEAKPEAVDWWQRRFNTPPIVPTQMPPRQLIWQCSRPCGGHYDRRGL